MDFICAFTHTHTHIIPMSRFSPPQQNDFDEDFVLSHSSEMMLKARQKKNSLMTMFIHNDEYIYFVIQECKE